MDQPLKILVIENTPADYLLLLRELRQHGVEADYHCISSDAELASALDSDWGIVITDYRLPGMDFRQTLQRIKQRHPNLPIIMVSGQLTEEVGIELIPLGLSDFILKGRLARLPNAIEHALAEAEEHRARLNAEHALRISEARLQLALEAAGTGLWDWDLRSGLAYLSEQYYAMTGYRPGDVTPDLDFFQRTVLPDDLPDVMATMTAHLNDETASSDVDYRMVTRTGEVKWIRGHGQVVERDGSGTPLRMIGTISDITTRKKNELRLQKLAQAVEQSPECILITDTDGNITFVNEAMLNISGYSREEIIGQTPRVLRSDRTPPETYTSMWQTLQTGAPWRGQFFNRRKDGSEYVVFGIISPIYQGSGQVTHYVATLEDITEKIRLSSELDSYRRHLEELVTERTQQLLQAKEQAEFANQAKSRFLASMSHEIRTPMNAIIGLTELCLDTELSLTQRSYIHDVSQSAKLLLGIVNDVLDLSKIEAGAMQLEKASFNITSLQTHLLSTMGHLAHEKHIDFQFDISENVPKNLIGDSLKLNQILLNLCSNAIKFTNSGGVHVNCDALAQTEDAATLHFSVRDTGIGIPPELQQHIFSPFTQADSSTTRKFGGTGLGLAISNKLVDLLGGKIWVESTIDQGSTFHFTAQLALPPTQASVAQHNRIVASDTTSLQNHRVLLVEDNYFNQRVAMAMLTKLGCQVSLADNGLKALAALAGSTFDVVLMDIQMPEMDGITAARKIRAEPRWHQLPIIALTANVTPADKAACLAAGMNDFIAKPIARADLLDALLRQMIPAAAEGSVVSAVSAQAPCCIHNVPGFDVDIALARIDGDIEQYRVYLQMFRDLNADGFGRIKSACQQGDLKTARMLAHSLKGGAGTIGANQLQKALADLEAMLGSALPSDKQLSYVAEQWDIAQSSLSVLLRGNSG